MLHNIQKAEFIKMSLSVSLCFKHLTGADPGIGRSGPGPSLLQLKFSLIWGPYQSIPLPPNFDTRPPHCANPVPALLNMTIYPISTSSPSLSYFQKISQVTVLESILIKRCPLSLKMGQRPDEGCHSQIKYASCACQFARFTKRAPPCGCACQLHRSRQNH